MRRDKKMRDGKLAFVLSGGIGRAFTTRDVPPEVVSELLVAEGCIT
jgi:shikimate kinase/3-dehydroquinate synthase